MRTDLAYMRVRAFTLIATVFALALVPSTAFAAPKKVFFKWSAGGYSVAENAGHFDLTIQRSGNTRVAASVDVSITGGTAVSGTHYTFTPQTVNFAAGESSKKVTATIIDNSTANAPNKTVVFHLANAQAGSTTTQIKAPSNATLTIVDDEGPGQIDFSSNSYTVLESGGFATITVSRIAASNLVESVDYATSSGTATTPSDYTATTGTLTFAAGEMSKTFQVPITDDSNAESAETVNLTLSNPKNLSGGSAPTIGGNSPAVLTINDDDVSTYSFQSSLFSVGESNGQATVTVIRSGATNIPSSVNYQTSDGTATAGSDYTATNGTLNFAAGETQKTFMVAITGDSADEPNETVDLSLSSGATAELSIVDDDNPNESVQFSDTQYTINEAAGTATITVTLSHALGVQTTVNYATGNIADTATDGSDYTGQSGTLMFDPGETEQTFDIPIINPATPDPEDNETVTLTLSAPGTSLLLGDPSTATLTIVDDDPPGLLDFKALSYSVSETGGLATVTVRRTDGSGGPVSVDYATSDGTATAGSDYTATSGTLNWASGDTADKTFTVPVNWDGRGEATETINLVLSNANGADLGATTAAVIRIADDGASGPLQLTSSSYNVGEADGLVTITVTRSGGSLGGPVSVDYATSDGSATAGSDYTATSGTLTFGPGEATRSFTVPVGSDSAHEDAEAFQVTLSNPGGGASLGSPAGATVTIADDDPAPATGGAQSTPANPNPSAAADKTAPKLTLRARAIQRALKVKRVALSARCNEACTLKVIVKVGTGKKAIVLGRATARAASGKTSAMKVKLSKRALAKLLKALKGGKAKIVLTVTATDAAGNKAAGSRKVTVKA